MSSHTRSIGKRGHRLIIFSFCACFWIIVAFCYFDVHRNDHKSGHSSSKRTSGILRRDTRDRVDASVGMSVEEKITTKRQRKGIFHKHDRPKESSFVKAVLQANISANDVHREDTIPVKSTLNDPIFPPCNSTTEWYFFDPSLLKNLKNGEKMRQFTGRKLVPYVSVYPSDGTVNLNKVKKDGNTVIARKALQKLRDDFNAAPVEGPLKNGNVLRVERMTLPDSLSHGGRLFLLEIAAMVGTEFTYHMEYVIDDGQVDGHLCHPIDYVINLASTIHIIVTVKNLGEQVALLITELEKLYQKSADEHHFQLILADFNSTDMNLDKMVYESDLNSKIKVLHMGEDKYNKMAGVTAAVDLVQDPSDIIFLCDLHMVIPSLFLTDIRKHVIIKKMVFAPVVGKLGRGATPGMPTGEWDTNGFGLIAMTKADWNMIGGFDKGNFKGDQWGGEDWDMIDRIVGAGLLVNRRRIPGLLHQYHTKDDMWAGGRYTLVGGGKEGGEKEQPKEKEKKQSGDKVNMVKKKAGDKEKPLPPNMVKKKAGDHEKLLPPNMKEGNHEHHVKPVRRVKNML